MGGRFSILIGATGLAYAFLLFNLFNLQLAHGQYYLARAGSQYAASGALQATRGVIYFTDKKGNHLSLAVNKDFPLVYVIPKVMDNYIQAAAQLAPLLNVSEADLAKRLAKKGNWEALLKKADPEVVQKIMQLNIKGVYEDEVPARYYPLGSLAAHVTGFVAPSEKDNGEVGRYGVEEFYNSLLSGKAGALENGKFESAQLGQDLFLTIDPNIQKEAEQILTDLVKAHAATGGSVIVEDPQTGKLLALAGTPSFDPNNYSDSPLSNLINPITQQIYEPGSVFKVFTMAAGIDSGKITPDTTFNDTGSLVLNGRKIQNWDLKAHGLVTMTNVIEKSLNTGAAFAERQTGDAIFKNYLTKFGFNDKTGIDLPGELAGDLHRLFRKDAPPVAFATASFGQGVAITPLHVINAFSAIANGGTLYRPYINANLQPQAIRTVISKETSAKVARMMVSAVDKAEIAKINGYFIAGKTGTAQMPDFKHGGYTDKVINTYVGFGPTSNARFVVLIRLNEPAGAPLAGLTVVPAFRDLAQFILNYWEVPPDRIEITKAQ